MNPRSILAHKLGRLLKGGYTPLQVLQRINRSPLRHLVKALATVTHVRGKLTRRAYAKPLPATPETEALNASGYAMVTPDAALLEELCEAAAVRDGAAGQEHRRPHKDYLTAYIVQDMRAGRIDNASIYVRYALQPRIVDAVAKYFGEAPYLSYVALDLSENAGATLATSQLWHQDHDDTKVVKLFTYLTDVPDDAHGPFIFVTPRASRGVSASAATHLMDEAVVGRVPPDALQRMTGPAGSSFLVDTGRCYHMGSRIAPGNRRLMYTACYISWPLMYPNFRNYFAVKGALSARERLLLLPNRTRGNREPA